MRHKFLPCDRPWALKDNWFSMTLTDNRALKMGILQICKLL